MATHARRSVYEFAAGVAPQWWVWMASASAWSWIAARALHAPAPALGEICRAPRDGAPLLAWLGGWALMVVAMMYPLLGEPVRKLALASAPSRRARATLIFLGGYSAPWLVFGLGCGALSIAKDGYFGTRADATLAAGGFALAAIWACAPARRHALHACGSAPPAGQRADLACLRHGGQVGWHCLLSCWALMVALAISEHGASAMAAVTALLLLERHWRPCTGRLLGVACAAAAAHYGVDMAAGWPMPVAGYFIG